VRPSYRSRPYEFGGGILFSFEHDGRIRDAFVPPDLLNRVGQIALNSEKVDFVERHADLFIPAARREAARYNPPALLTLDYVDS
jgi:hypothetical protein